VLDTKLDLPQLGQPILGHEDGDTLQVVGEHRQGPGPFLAVLAVKQRRLDVDGPALDVRHDGIEAGAWSVFSLAT
jgi:hypothetical protein